MANVFATIISLASILILAYAWVFTDRFHSAPWWAGPLGIVIAALPTSVRAGVVRSVVARVLPSKG